MSYERSRDVVRDHRIAVRGAIAILASDLGYAEAEVADLHARVAVMYEGLSEPEVLLACHEDPLWEAAGLLGLEAAERMVVERKVRRKYEAFAEVFDDRNSEDRDDAKGPRLVERRVGGSWLVTSPDVDGLYVAAPDRDEALARVAPTIDALERVRSRISATRGA